MSYERANIQRMTGYAPGEQPEETSVIKLNTNENPYPATAAVAEALRGLSIDDLRRYPQPVAEGFRQAAADCHRVNADNIIPTNGGDELLRLAITTFVDAGDTLGIAEPSYSLYPVLAEVHGCRVARIPLDESWRMSQDFGHSLNEAGARLAFVVNPHAPSGILTGVEQLARIAEDFNGVLVVDEAYADFIDPALEHNAIPLIRDFDNVLILRTLSKGYSLAGLRFGYGIGAASLIAPMLYKTRDSYNTDAVSQALATAALRSREDAARSWQKVRAERDHLQQELERLGLTCLPSQSNFLLARASGGSAEEAETKARQLYQRLKQDRILVRYFDQPRLRDKLRITVGTPGENEQLLRCLRSYG